MRQSNLAATIAMALLAVSTPQSLRAVHLSPSGVGQVLVFPYYTANAGNQTLLSVVNKTDSGKAIKVRFREARNSRTVQEFNLYLSPFDVWTATLSSLNGSNADSPAILVTNDNSCTVPSIKNSLTLPALSNGSRYLPFHNRHYSGSRDDAGPNKLERTREGYFELIEMGEVTDQTRYSLSSIVHGPNGIPGNCLRIEQAWLPLNPEVSTFVTYWSANALTDMYPPGGGLFGNATIIDALAGTMLSYKAEAIGAFSDIVQHTGPASVDNPSLGSAHESGSGDMIVANVFYEDSVASSYYPASRAIDAVSALFAKDALFNEFSASSEPDTASEWIITFPTKYAYADQAIVGLNAVAPFTQVFPITSSASNNGTAAVEVELKFYDREAAMGGPTCSDPIDPNCVPFFPPPRGPNPFLYWATNVATFNQPNASSSGSEIFGSRLVTNVDANESVVVSGWAQFSFYSDSYPYTYQQRMRADMGGGVWHGLPAIGFWASAQTNAQIAPGVLSQYIDVSRLRGSSRYTQSVLRHQNQVP